MKYIYIKNNLHIIILFLSFVNLNAIGFNGFDLSNSTIDTNKILSGGPPRDGIPSINNPKFIKVKNVAFLKDDDMVIGVIAKNEQKAYPTRILVWHEIVNDKIENKNIVVTYCPLCGTGMVFESKIDGITRSFGVSGLLYNSDVLMYDRQTNSLWSQLLMKAVSGVDVNKKLNWINSHQMTWKAWKSKYPNSKILSTNTGYTRNYQRNAYSDYFKSDKPMFEVDKNRFELKDREWVVGIIVSGIAKAYSLNDLIKHSIIKDNIHNTKVTIKYNKKTKYIQVFKNETEEIASVSVFWFAWQAFYPNTKLWEK